MSVMILDDNVYQEVLDSLDKYTTHPYFLPHSFDVEKIILTLRDLVYQSFMERYSETIKVPKFRRSGFHRVNIYQLLKRLQCIRYQIEGKAEKHEAVKYLDNMIERITSGIISEIPEYRSAQWSE